MTKKEIVSLSLKLAGIYCLIMAITHLSYAIQSIVSSLRQDFWYMLTSITAFVSLILSLTPFVLLLLFGFYLIFSNKLPSKIASLMTQEEKTTSFTFQDIQVLAFSIIGVWLLSSAVPGFIRLIVQGIVHHLTSQQSVSAFKNSIYISHIVATVLKIALGIFLFSGGNGLAKLWQKFHSTRGMKPSGNN
jgi:ABC-type sulfate transport system permease component